MTVDEVTTVHVVVEEEVQSSSSKVEIAEEEDLVKKNGNEDFSNGVNGRTAREDNDGDGDYVFVNGNEEENGGPVESDLEKNGNGIAGRDQGVESMETEGEVKSKTDLVKDLSEEDESCIEIVDQDKESMELCHAEASVDEQKSVDLIRSGPVFAINAENGVSETATADQNRVSESAEDVSDAKNIGEHTGSGAAAVDSSDKQSDEIFSISGPDVNGSANGSVEANVLDFRSRGNEEFEIAVADDSDYNGDGLANDNAKAAAVNDVDFSSKENDSSEMAEVDASDCNGDGLADDSAKASVSEANDLDFRSKENKGSEMAVIADGDRNRDGLANDGANDTVSEANVLDFRSKENDGSEMAVADDGDCSGEGLSNDSAKATVSEANVIDSRSKENGGSEMAVADDGDCNGNALANDTVSEANVLDSRLKENGGSEMAVADDGDCNGNVLANDSAKATVSEANAIYSRSKETEGSEIVVADDGNCNGDGLANDSAKATVSEANVLDSRNKQNEVCELPVTDDGVTTISVSDRDGDCLPDVREKDTVSEAVLVDSSDEQNESSNSGEVEADSACLFSNVNGDRPEQNRFSETTEMVLPDVVSGIESVKVGESLTAADEFPMKSGLGLEHITERDLGSVDDTNLEKETGSGSFSDECGEALQDVHTEDGISGTVQINDSVDSGQPSELVESSISPITNKNVHVTVEGVLNDTIADVVECTSATVTLNNDASVESGVSDTAIEALPPSSVDDEKLETEVIESDENSRAGFENKEIDVKDASGSIDDNFKSRCLTNGGDSILSAESEVSKVLVECHSSETDEKVVDVVDVQNDSNSVATVSNDEKAPAADISNNVELVHESRESACDANNNKQSPAVMKEAIRFGSVVTCQESEGPEGLDEVKRSPFYFLIRVPRYDDENLKEKIRLAQITVDEKTHSRDAVRTEIQKMRAICKKYGDNVEAAISQERAIRDQHRSKRQEIDSIQSIMNIEDIDAKIRNMEHMIQHETMPLKDEKQYIHQIKQYKQTREWISSNMGKQDEVLQGPDQKEQIKERMKSLKKEADQLKVNLLKAEAVTKAAKKEYHDEAEKLNKLQSQFKAADDIRQDAYSQLLSLKKQSYEKNNFFWQYRDDAKAANDLALKGDKEALQNLCVNQVKNVMDLWNNNDEFRKEYIRCNVRSTLRRLRTFDGRALGPDEEPPVIPQVVIERVAKDRTVSNSTFEEQTQAETGPAKAETAKDKPAAKTVEQKNETSKPEKPVKPVPPASGSATASSRDTIEEAEEEKPKITKEEEERLRKAEELRKEQEAAKLREQRRLEEIAKAKEALERKRRNAEKAQARAELRAQKEAEQKEKEREKRAKKKERRKGASVSGDASVIDETESAPTLETPTETLQDSQSKEKPVTVAKRSQKPTQFTKQSKAKAIPPPLRNRGKRKMQPWMWVLLTCLVIFALFLVGNYNFSFDFGLLQKFKF
ncbi:RNI-like superfamily protein isoform 1 [Hibiscus syriacus]|uniref:RNI-like superfamily protein isoform 1 n=1 Tax=Hibiscus syriacus TaxID=106335 RepID=A0A6A2XWR8_HIBSY|nr:RNI-like superfamily protein isoform 1 [Hibiscus syriacus]